MVDDHCRHLCLIESMPFEMQGNLPTDLDKDHRKYKLFYPAITSTTDCQRLS